MNKKIVIASITTLVFACIFFFGKPVINLFVTKTQPKKTEGGGQYHFMQRSFPYGKVDYSAQRKAAESFKNNTSALRNASAVSWQFAGPINVGGRITDIAINPLNPNSAYLSAASGGVFKTTDGGNSWSAIFDNESTLSIGDLAIAPSDSNIIYVGTGEANGGSGSLTYDANGIYKSTDAGGSWINIGLQNSRMTGKVEVHPTNPDIVFAATMGNLYGKGPDRGLYRTTNGGTSWTKVLFVNDSTGAIDVVINPTNPNLIFCSTWQRTRYADAKYYQGVESGIWKSTDGGTTWTRLGATQGLPALGVDYSRIGLAIAPSNPQVMYASYHDTNGFLGMWKSVNAGTSWIRIDDVNNTANVITAIYWEGKITVDPNNEDVVYLTGLELYKSTDGGIIFTPTFTDAHVDHHSVAIHPSNSNIVWNGHDGGLNISNNAGLTSVHNETLPISQVYRLEIDNTLPSNLYNGLQDNGTSRTPTGLLNDYEFLFGGDGFQPLVAPTNNQVLFVQYQYGNLFKSTDGGLNFNFATNGIFGSANWNTPIVFDPADDNTMYYGSQKVFQSLDQGDNWIDISPDLTTVQPTNLLFGTIFALDVSPINSNIIYAGCDDGNVWNTLNGGGTWTNITGTLPQRWITQVECDPFNAATAYVTLSGYRFNDNMSHIYKTTNNGLTWTSISGNLPPIPVNDIDADPSNQNVLYAATDVGVYFTTNGGNSWNVMGAGMPIVVCNDIKIHQPTRTLVVGTYGRGMYKINLDLVLGIKNSTQQNVQIKITPTLISDYFDVIDNSSREKHIAVFDINGRKNFETSFKQLHFRVQTENWKQGVYFVEVNEANNKVVKKIVVN